MSEMKKLFRRDKWFLVISILFVMAVFSVWGAVSQKTIREHQIAAEAANAQIVARGIDLEPITEVEISQGILEDLRWMFVMFIQMLGTGVLILQIIKWQIFEGKRVRAFQNILPIKASTYITYDYVWGMIFGWLPTILLCIYNRSLVKYPTVKDSIVFLIVEMFMYSLFIFSKNVTNHIVGAFLFYELLIYFELVISAIVFEQESLAYTWSMRSDLIKTPYIHLAVYTVLTVLFVWLSYFCGKKRDLSGNGMFFNKIVHYIALAMLLVILIMLFGSVYYVKGAGVWRILLVGILAFGVTGGTHYLIRPKRI